MGYSRSDLRPGMDVYTKDNQYLGAILDVLPGPSGATDAEHVSASARQSSTVSGESMGPVPTQALGNTGPTTQSARALYASQPGRAATLGSGKLVVGRWWGRVGRRTIAIDAIQTVALERVNLKLRRDQLAD